ncbi:hypothetical protein [Ottowia caeni]|uniref:hypothetical protein n=1 Tax=Ottowia caeni TaxID=2870339 RepID=UPI003D71D34D
MTPAAAARWLDPDQWRMRRRSAMRALLSHYVLNGASCAFGLFLVSAVMQGLFGHAAAAAAVVGVIASIPRIRQLPRAAKPCTW